MVCLATWKDGSNKYLVAKMEHKLAMSDEEKYRCFIYERKSHLTGVTYYEIAQSGDATCNGIQSSSDGSKTMHLTRSKMFYFIQLCSNDKYLSVNIFLSFDIRNISIILKILRGVRLKFLSIC